MTDDHSNSAGNRLLTSLGNIETTPRASLTFIDFKKGDVLYLTGEAQTLVGQDAQDLMPRQNVVTTVHITGFIFVRDAFPLRERPGSEVTQSPYSPPIRFLSEELKSGAITLEKDISVTLASIKLHSQDLATFTWETSSPVHILPGQAAVLDFTSLLGVPQYAHMAPLKPSSVNDDRIRTWTISSAHPSRDGTNQFALTMREKPGGAVTGALFSIARKLASVKPELLVDSRLLGLSVKLVGIAGDFTLQRPLSVPSAAQSSPTSTVSMLWVAGGIGITPFLSMLAAITSKDAEETNNVKWDIVLAVSTRETNVLLPLIFEALQWSNTTPQLHLAIDIFSHDIFIPPSALPNSKSIDVTCRHHPERISGAYFSEDVPEVTKRTPYLCGPEAFERTVLNALGELGVATEDVKREGFAY